MDKTSYIYFLANRPNGTLYLGATTDLVRRVHQHKARVIPGFTAKYNLNMLVYFEIYPDLEQAYSREYRLKKWHRAWKVALIECENPDWCDLWDTITS